MEDKVQKIREEIERLKEWQPIATPSLNILLSLIDTMQEEPVSEELEEATNAYISNENNYSHSRTDTFKAGAEWQLNKIRKKYEKNRD